MSVVSNNGPVNKIKTAPGGRPVIVAALDIGSTKICCLIARISKFWDLAITARLVCVPVPWSTWMPPKPR